MLTTLQLDTASTDFWGNYNASAIARMGDAMERKGCLLPRFALVPGQGLQTIPGSGKIVYNFRLTPGSAIWGLWPLSSPGLFNITDVCLQHMLFQDPLENARAFTLGGDTADWPSFTLLPSPWPVLGDGLFTLDAWGTPGDLAYFVLGVAELPPC